MKTPRYRLDPRFVARAMALLMAAGAWYVAGPMPVFASAPRPAASSKPLSMPAVSTPPSTAVSTPAASSQVLATSVTTPPAPAKATQKGPMADTVARLKAAQSAQPKEKVSTPVSAAQQQVEDQARKWREKVRSEPAQKAVPASAKPSSQPVAADGSPSDAIDAQLTDGLGNHAFVTYNVSYVWNIYPTPSQNGNMTVTAVNGSQSAWPAGSVSMSYHVYDSSGNLVTNMAPLKTRIGVDVPRGYKVTVNADVQPLNPGYYNIFFDLYDNTASANDAFFSQQGSARSYPAVGYTVPTYPLVAKIYSPYSGATVNTTTPIFQTEVDNNVGYANPSGWLEICPNAGGTGCWDSGWQALPPADTVIHDSLWNPTPNASAMPKWNQEYWWRLKVAGDPWSSDPNLNNGPWSGMTPIFPLVPEPTNTSHYGVVPGTTDAAGVGMFLGNYTRQEQDLSLPGPAGSLPLQISRVYNSVNSSLGAFGVGWSSLLDVSLQFGTAGGGESLVTVTFPDGKQTTFSQNNDGSGWTAAYGEDQSAVFVNQYVNGVSDTHLDFGSGTRYVFGSQPSSGAPYPLAQVIAPNGDTLTLNRSNGQVNSITDSSSHRSLYVTWNGGQVSSVAADGSGSLGWHYYYSGLMLSQVCDAEYTPNCTSYSYGEAGPINYQKNTNFCVDVDTNTSTRVQFWACNGQAQQQWVQYPDGSLRAFGNRCLDTAGQAQTHLTPVVVSACTGAPTQRWDYQQGSDSSLKIHNTNMCLDLNNGTQTQGVQLQIWDCNHLDPQTWIVPSSPITYQGVPNKCIDLDTSTASKVQLWDCNGLSQQRWVQYPDGTLQVWGKCLDTGNATSSGAQLQATVCNGMVGQQWRLRLDGTIWNPFSGLCLTDTSGNVNNGTWLTINTCYNTPTEQWGVPAVTPRMTVVQRPNGNSMVSIDYNGAYVSRVGDSPWNVSTHSWPNSSFYNRTPNPDPSNPNRALRLQVTDPTQVGSNHQPGVQLWYDFGPQGQLMDRFIGAIDANHERVWVYDSLGRVSAMIDENSNLTEYYWDSLTGVLSDQNQYRDVNTVVNTHYWYIGDVAGDPNITADVKKRYGREPLQITDPNRNVTSMAYNYGNGLVTSRTTPLPTGASGSATTTYAYTCDGGAGAPVAHNDSAGGNQPCGLLSRVTDPDGHVTTYQYNHYGDQTQVVSPDISNYTESWFDAFGRMTSKVVYTRSHPEGATYTYGYDTHLRVTSVIEPTMVNSLYYNTPHQRYTVNGYDGDGNLVRQSIYDNVDHDLYSADNSRATVYTYDGHDRQTSVSTSDPSWNDGQRVLQVATTNYDATGHLISRTDARGYQYNYIYYYNGLLYSVNLVDGSRAGGQVQLASYSYDLAGNVTQYVTAGALTSAGTLQQQAINYTYTNDNLVKTQTAANNATIGHDITLHTYGYDLNGNVTQDVQGSPSGTGSSAQRTTSYTYDGANNRATMVVNPSGSSRTTTYAYDAAGLIRTTSLTGYSVSQGGNQTNTTTNNYDSTTGYLTSTVVTNSPNNLTTYYTRDGANLLTVTDPNTYVTTNTYDLLGRLATTQRPQFYAEDGNGNGGNVNPTISYGYNTFGEITQVKDARGNITSVGYDNRGQKMSVQKPSYITPAGNGVYSTERWTYDNAGNVASYTDPRNSAANYTYDNRNRATLVTLPPLHSGDPATTVAMAYDDDGNLTSFTDPFGAVTNQSFDSLDRLASTTKVVRQVSGNYTTTYSRDDFGELTASYNSAISASALTTKNYNQFGEVSSETSLGRGYTYYGYDQAGHLVGTRQQVTTTPTTNNRYVYNTYDQAGRMTNVAHKYADSSATSGAQVTVDSTAYGYDNNGNVTSLTDPRGNIWYSSYDAANQLRQRTDPASWAANGTTYLGQPVTYFGYDANGNQTRQTDGRGNVTLQSYQSWNLPEKRTEPAAGADPAVTWTTSYDAAGSPVLMNAPGGIVQNAIYDARGRLSGLNATGGDGNVSKTFGYDAADRMTSACPASPCTLPSPLAQTFSYDDRGLITSSGGPQGNASYSYDALGRLTSQTDPAGTVTQTYSGVTDISTIADTLSNTTRTNARDLAGQVTTEQYSVGSSTGASRTYTYDNVGRIATDTTKSPANANTSQLTYSYDLNGNVTGIAAYGAGGNSGQFGNTTQTNTYDAANRLTRYQFQDAIGGYTNGKDYNWDNAGNRTTVNTWSGAPSGQSGNTYSATTTSAYDARNRLISTSNTDGSPIITYNWSARGTQTSSSQSSTTNRFDAFDRMIVQDGSTYSYDALDRLASAGGTSRATFQYAGLSAEPSTDGTWSIARSGNGTPIAAWSGSQYSMPPRALQTNVHGDVDINFDPLTGGITGSRQWDPFGNLTTSNGINNPSVGFQGSWQDYNGMVSAQARWLNPKTGSFMSHDPGPQTMTNAASINNYGYANANPTTNSDPNGRWSISIDWGAVGKGISRIGQGLNAVAKGIGGMRFTLPIGSAGDLLEGGGTITDGALTAIRSSNWSTLLRGLLQIGVGDGIGLGGILLDIGAILVSPEAIAIGLGIGLAVGGYYLYRYLRNGGGNSGRQPGIGGGGNGGYEPCRPGMRCGGVPIPCTGPNCGPKPPKPPQPPPPPPPPPWVVRTNTSWKTTTWQSTNKYWDDTYVYNRVDNYSQTFSDQKTYYSNGAWTDRWQRSGVSDNPQITRQLITDFSHPDITVADAPGPPVAPTDAGPASSDGVCGHGGTLSTCASGGGALPPQAVGYGQDNPPATSFKPRASGAVGCDGMLTSPWLAPVCSPSGGAGTSYMKNRSASLSSGHAGAEGAFLAVTVP